MGVVYRARELSLDRPVAIKLINDDRAGDGDAHRRFQREARLMASIDHPNVIPVYAAGEQDGHLYLVMRYVDGTDLQALLRAEGRLAPERAARITDQVARALDAAHERGLVHRDIKPSNVLISGDHAYLTDFGITRLVDERTNSTDAGTWLGTFDYMSPEQLRSEPTGVHSDVYSLGCLLYACLAGSPPFHRETTAATIAAQLHEEPPSVTSVPGVPKQLDEVVRRALAKRPRDRYVSAGQLGSAAITAAERTRNGAWGFLRRSRRDDATASRPEIAQGADQTLKRASEIAATVVSGDAETRVARTVVMPSLSADSSPADAAPGRNRRFLGSRAHPVDALMAAALLVTAIALAVIELSANSSSAPGGALTAGEITTAVHQFANDYSTHDVHSLGRLLAADVTRVDPSSAQHGRAAVLKDYESQFATEGARVSYALSHVSVITGWAGRAQAMYTLRGSGGTVSGRVVFGLQRDADRVQVALISTQ
jgi:predicted Ser/Thr protein kinase